MIFTASLPPPLRRKRKKKKITNDRRFFCKLLEKSVHNISVLPIGLESESVISDTGDSAANAAAGTTTSSSADSASWLVKLEPSSIVQNCVMAMLNANVNDSVEKLCQAEVLGFVHVYVYILGEEFFFGIFLHVILTIFDF